MRTSTVKALVLEGIFIACYFLLRDHIDDSGRMPRWLAIGLLSAVALDSWAVWFKLRAVRYEIDSEGPVLPANIVVLCIMAVVRMAVFVVMVLMAWDVLVGARLAESSTNWLIAAILAKELLVLYILVSAAREGHREGKPPWAPWVFFADVVLVLSAEFVLLLLDQLFSKPSLDLSWNPVFLVVMTGLFGFLFLLFALPFRILYSFESLKGSDSAVLYETASIFVMLASLLWFSLYNSEKTSKHFLDALNSRPTASEFSYSRPARIPSRAFETLCRQPLVNLELHVEYVDYLPTCIYELASLRSLDVQDNALGRMQLGDTSQIIKLNASGNRLPNLASLGFSAGKASSPIEHLDLSYNQIRSFGKRASETANLRWLDLSHNPLTKLDIAPGALPELETLRLVDTDLPASTIESLQRSRPHLKIEY